MNIAISRFFFFAHFFPFFLSVFLELLLMAPECVVVFRIRFRILVKESESVETSPGFAWLLGENWGFKAIYI